MRRTLLALLTLALPACSVKSLAVNALGNALSEGTSSWAKDEDSELVGDAIPFGLKTIESLIEEAPRHRGLLFSAASGFTQYGYGWLAQEADFVEDKDLARATHLRDRARRLYLRALDYGLRGLEVDVPGFRRRLRQDPQAALSRTRKKQVRLLYWCGIAWGAAISISKADSELTADQHLVEALMRRALVLDESWEYGSIHDFFVSYEGGRSSVGGSLVKAREHLDRALALSKGGRAAPLVAYAESVAVAKQDRTEFRRVLEQALRVEPGRIPEQRLSNVLYQKRARWLRQREDDLFLE